MVAALLWGGLAASSLLVGFALGECRLSNRTVGLIMGFGAGALISALAYELVPESVIRGWQVPVLFVAGVLVFFGGDWLIARWGGRHRKTIAGRQHEGSGGAIFLGTLLDAIPESLVLGMGLAIGGSVGVAFLAAVFISNMPEGVAGTVNLKVAGHSRLGIFWMWAALVALSAGCSVLGYGLVQWIPSADDALAQAFAAGAVLTMLSETMIPEAYEHGGRLVGLATVVGFGGAAALSVLA
jgi:zinc transporter, ZIP family